MHVPALPHVAAPVVWQAVAQQMLTLGLVASGTHAPLVHWLLVEHVEPLGNVGETHCPPLQVWFDGQTCPHAPQLLLSEMMLVVHPAPLQFAHPVLQVIWHAPDTHDTELVLIELHTWPHAPQLLTSLVSVAQ